jgi:hypothetical protein
MTTGDAAVEVYLELGAKRVFAGSPPGWAGAEAGATRQPPSLPSSQPRRAMPRP